MRVTDHALVSWISAGGDDPGNDVYHTLATGTMSPRPSSKYRKNSDGAAFMRHVPSSQEFGKRDARARLASAQNTKRPVASWPATVCQREQTPAGMQVGASEPAKPREHLWSYAHTFISLRDPLTN